MAIWKLLLITLLSAVVLGCLVGVLVGKHRVRKQAGDYHPLLGTKERILYAACILLGAGCIVFGLLYSPPGESGGEEEIAAAQGAMPDSGAAGEGAMPDGGAAGEGAMPDSGAAGEGAMPDADVVVGGDVLMA